MTTRHLAFFALLLALLASCAGGPNPDVLKARVTGNQAEELRLLQAAIQKDPNLAENHYQLALRLEEASQLEQAKASIQRALLLASQTARYRLLAGRLHYKSQEYFQAIHSLSTAASLDGNLLEAQHLLALAYEKTGKLDQSLAQLALTIRLEPLYFPARLDWVRLSLAKTKDLENLPQLIQEMKDTLALQPGSPEGAILLARLYLAQGAQVKARLHLEAWSQAWGQQTSVDLERARILLAERRPQEALALLQSLPNPGREIQILSLQIRAELEASPALEAEIQKLLAQDPKESQLHLLLGRLQLQQGQSREAERSLQKVLTLAPDSAQAHFLLSRLWFEQGDKGGAKWAVRKAISLDPALLEARLHYMKLLLSEGNLELAQQVMDQAKLDGDHHQVAFYRGLLAKERGDFLQAREWLSFASRSAFSLETEIALADLALEQGNYYSAKQQVDLLKKLKPEHWQVKLAEARLLLAQNQVVPAVELLLPHKDIRLGHGKLQHLLARLWLAQGKEADATALLAKSLEVWPRQVDLALLYTQLLGWSGHLDKALPLLAEMAELKGAEGQLFRQRLTDFTYRAGQKQQALRLLNQNSQP